MKILRCLAGTLALFALPLAALAEVHLPAIFGNHMVLQQDRKIPVWGWADPGERVSVSFGGRGGQAVAGATGRWSVELAPVPSSSAPGTLTVSGLDAKGVTQNLSFTDVLVGDVWLASGQSNMERELGAAHTAAEDVPKANDPQLRVFRIPRTNRMEPQTDMAGAWQLCTPQDAGGFTAVGYYFARELRHTLNRPIGLIATYWGGTPVQSWVSLTGLEKPPAFTNLVQWYQKQNDQYLRAKDAFPKAEADYEAARKTWDAEVKPAYDTALKAWLDATAQAKAAGQPLPPKPLPSRPAPGAPPNPLGPPNVPTSLYNGMIAPVIPFAIKGVIWYQGESDADHLATALQYGSLFPRMISDWREKWGEGDFPFLFVQIANYIANKEPDAWAALRDSQRLTLSLPKTGMASAADIGNPHDIHPKDKRDVGLRLAQAAKAIAYGLNAVPSGPLYTGMKLEGGKVRLLFSNLGGGLKIGVPPWTFDGKPPVMPAELTGFTIAGADHRWLPARARIDGGTVVVWNDQLPAPAAVRYGWAENPELSLYNQEGLPASPFRTDSGKP